MMAIDTNVLVRLLTNDDPDQSPRAAALFASEDVFIAKTVLLETEWVLRFSYGMGRPAIQGAFAKLLDAATVTVEDPDRVRIAIDWYGREMDLADALHVTSGGDVEKFATFDKKLGQVAARCKAAPPVEVI